MNHRVERGDTLVEVLIAIAVLGAAIVGGLTIMNFGYSIANNAVERTQVQATMNGQLAYIRYARDAYVRANQQATDPGSRLWAAIKPKIEDSTPSNGVCSAVGTPQFSSNSFSIPEDLANIGAIAPYSGTAASTFAQPGNGMWIEARRAGGAAVKYVDFYVKACWQPSGGSTNQEARTVMRLYVP